MENSAKSFLFKGKKPVLVLILVILIAPFVYRMARVNLYSLQILRERFGQPMMRLAMDKAPAGHGRAELWQAQEALGAGDAARASAFLQPMVQQGYPLAISLEGDTLLAEGQYEAAVDLYEQAGDYQSLMEAGAAALANRDYDSALLAYQKASGINEEETVSAYAGVLRVVEGEASAEALLRIAIERFSKSHIQPAWRNSLGSNLLVQGRLEEAEAVYREALDLYPAYIYLVTGLGRVLANQGERDQAAAQFERAMSAFPKEGDGYYEMGILLASEERYTEADVFLKEATRLEQLRPGYIIERGSTALRAGNWSLAIEVFREGTERFPQDGRAYGGLARAFYHEGRLAEAQEAIEHALALPPDSGASGWVWAGMIYEARDDVERARVAFERAIAIDPQNKPALAGLERVKNP